MEKEINVIQELEKLRRHHYNNFEDMRYSCSKSEAWGKNNTSDCDCGADEHNRLLERIINKVLEMERGGLVTK